MAKVLYFPYVEHRLYYTVFYLGMKITITHKSGVQITLDSASITVLKAILHQVEQVKTKRVRRPHAKDSTAAFEGQLVLLSDTSDEKGYAN